MVEPVLVGALVWLSQIIAARGVERLMDGAMDAFGERNAQRGIAPAAPIQRHDLTAPGAQVTSDVDITVRHHLAGFRAPTILTVQKFGDRSTGTMLPMVLGETAHLTLTRAHYLFAALVIDLPERHGDKPVLRGLGWAPLWLAANATTPLLIGTQHPTGALVEEVGLTQQDGSLVFTLPPDRPAAPRLRQWAAPQSHEQLLEQHRARVRQHFAPSRAVNWNRCRARAWIGEKQCEFLPVEDGLCRIHRQQAKTGRDVLDHATGQPIIMP